MCNYIFELKYREKGYDKLYKQRHSHDNCYEIIQTWSNDGYMMIKDKLYPITKGSLYLINALELHCSIPKNIDEYERSKIILSNDFIDQILTSSGEKKLIDDLLYKNGGSYLRLDEYSAAEADKLFHKAANALEENRNPGILVLSCLLNLLLLADSEYVETDGFNNGRIGEILSYINNNISETISLADICENTHVSKHYLCHMFRESTNMTVMKYILNRRLTIAKKKLLSDNLSISEVAMSSGFCSFSYFCNVFQKHEGMTPGEYRKRNGNTLHRAKK